MRASTIRRHPSRSRVQVLVPASRFAFHEKVRVVSAAFVAARGSAIGCVLSCIQGEPGVWIHPVLLYETGETFLFREAELESLGEIEGVEALCQLALGHLWDRPGEPGG